MTYSVPYSFVPGTKAKADEVNANFIDILNKIEETNERIDLANESLNSVSQEIVENFEEKFEEINATKADLSLSNIDSDGKTLFNNKANVSDIDGAWTSKYSELGINLTLNGTGEITLSLANYLPNDDKIYEVIFSASISKSGWKRIYMGTDLIKTKIPICASTNTESSSAIILPVGKSRNVRVQRNTNYSGTMESLLAAGYRKVR